MRVYDVVIVGGGVIGSSVAYFLATEPGFDGSVVVVERDPTYANGSTARSVGAFRQQFSTAENIEISKFGVRFFRDAATTLSVDGEAPEISFHEASYLFLATAAGMPILRRNHKLQQQHEVDVRLLDPGELGARFPWLRTDDLAAGSLGIRGEGWLDPYGLLLGFRRKAESLGVEYRHGEVTGLERRGSSIGSVALADGTTVACGAVVNAAGPAAARVARLAGVKDLPVRPRKRMVYTFDCRQALPDAPLVIDPSGVWFRPEADRFLCGVSPPADRDPDCLDLELDFTLFDDIVWPALAHRVPAFDAIKRGSCWAGHYAVNVRDHNAIVGGHPEVDNLWLANGFSGHGVQQSPAVGRALSELITYGEFRTLDLSRFAFERFGRGELIEELNVI